MGSVYSAPRFRGSIAARVNACACEVLRGALHALALLDELTADQRRLRAQLEHELVLEIGVAALRRRSHA